MTRMFLWPQWKVAPSLAAGNTAVLKPSELASVTCLELGAIAQEVLLSLPFELCHAT